MTMRYEVTPDLVTGNDLIDREHGQLFDAANKLLDSFSDKEKNGKEQMNRAATFLINYVDKHFGHEEELQKRSGWREFETHHKFHEEYKRQLREILDRIPEEGPGIQNISEINVHIVRLITHIRTMDKRLGAYLKTVK